MRTPVRMLCKLFDERGNGVIRGVAEVAESLTNYVRNCLLTGRSGWPNARSVLPRIPEVVGLSELIRD